MSISNQRIYLGPRLHAHGVGYGTVFYNGIHPTLQELINACPSIGELLIPVAQAAVVRRELAFDYGHNMKGTTGKYVTFYREVQNWLASQNSKKQTPTIKVTSHA